MAFLILSSLHKRFILPGLKGKIFCAGFFEVFSSLAHFYHQGLPFLSGSYSSRLERHVLTRRSYDFCRFLFAFFLFWLQSKLPSDSFGVLQSKLLLSLLFILLSKFGSFDSSLLSFRRFYWNFIWLHSYAIDFIFFFAYSNLRILFLFYFFKFHFFDFLIVKLFKNRLSCFCFDFTALFDFLSEFSHISHLFLTRNHSRLHQSSLYHRRVLSFVVFPRFLLLKSFYILIQAIKFLLDFIRITICFRFLCFFYSLSLSCCNLFVLFLL